MNAGRKYVPCDYIFLYNRLSGTRVYSMLLLIFPILDTAPTAAITELCTTNDAFLVPIDGDIADKLMADCPFYTAYTIPAGTYEGQTEDVTTVTVKATLIVSASASEDDVYNLTKAIFDNTAAIAAENGKGAELSVENATSGMSAPFHAGAAKYYAEKGVTVDTQ